jgi:hypothetical protein
MASAYASGAATVRTITMSPVCSAGAVESHQGDVLRAISRRTPNAAATELEAVRMKIGEALRSHYDIQPPLPERLYELVQQLERKGEKSSD